MKKFNPEKSAKEIKKLMNEQPYKTFGTIFDELDRLHKNQQNDVKIFKEISKRLKKLEKLNS